jgi:hypothetical protein
MGWSGHIALIQIEIELIRLVGSPALVDGALVWVDDDG